jgi:YVTN family beta-propeller protein
VIPPHPLRLLALAPVVLLAACRHDGLPTYPQGFREFAYVANRGANTVTVLDLVYIRVDRTIAVGNAPVAVVANPARDEVYVVNRASNSVSVIDTRDNHLRATIPVHREPVALALDPTGHRAFVVNSGSNLISVLDLDSDRAIAAVATGEHPDGLAIAPDGRTLVVTNGAAGSVSIYAAAVLPGRPVKTPEDPSPSPEGTPPLTLRAVFKECPGAASPVILGDSSKAFLLCSDSNQVMALSLAALPGSWNARQDGKLLADHKLALLDVGHHPTALTLKPDNGEIFASNTDSDSVSEINTQTNEVESTYVIGSRPAHAIVSGDSSALWVSNSGADSLSLYSISDGSRLPSISTGNAPDALAFSHDEILLLAADTKSGDVAVIRTNANPRPALLTMLPAGAEPVAIAVKAMPSKP